MIIGPSGLGRRNGDDQPRLVVVMVDNAGVMPLSPLSALTVDEWNRVLDVNVGGVLHGIAAALPVMQGRAAGTS